MRCASNWWCSSATASWPRSPVRRGPTKPTLEFSLTPDADKLFPQPYDKMLDAVLREVRSQFGTAGVERVFDGLSRRAIERAKACSHRERPRAEGRAAH